MIIRIFTAEIQKEFLEEFKMKFMEISVPLVKNYKGLRSLEIGEPTEWNPNEFIMISRWETVGDLINFAGNNWNESHIPDGMEHYIDTCDVSHYKNIDIQV